MATIQVKIHVQREAAIRRGSTAFGAQPVTLSEADLQSLSEAERAELALVPPEGDGSLNLGTVSGVGGQSHYVKVEVSGLEGVRAALAQIAPLRAARAAEQAQLEVERDARRRAAIAWALAAPVETLLCEDWRRTGYVEVTTRAPWELAHGEDIPWGAPELAARKATLDAEVERRNAEQEREQAEWKARSAKEQKEQEAREKAERQAYEAQFRAFAEAGHAGEAAKRAVREGYDVRAAVLDAVQAQLPAPAAVSRPKDDYSWEERPSPSAEAFALLDRITAAVKAAEKKPGCVTLEVSRVMRIETPPADEYEESGRKATGVVVTLASPITADRFLLYFVE